MKQRLKQWIFRLLGKDAEAVVVTFCSGDPDLCARMLAMLARPPTERAWQTASLAAHVAMRFSISVMVDSVMEGYAEAMARRAPGRILAGMSNLPSSA